VVCLLLRDDGILLRRQFSCALLHSPPAVFGRRQWRLAGTADALLSTSPRAVRRL